MSLCLIGRRISPRGDPSFNESRRLQLAAVLESSFSTKDDKIADDAQADKAIPRDNVVFEAGFFPHAKGKDRVLIVLEEGCKMPADLGGDIYALLEDKADTSSIEPYIRRFVEEQL